MNKYVLHYHAPAEAMAKMANSSPEEKAEGMKPWLAWKDRLGDKLVDFGSPMMGATRVNANGDSSQNASEITGYSIIQAESKSDAEALLENHPHLSWTEGCAIEMFECISM